MRRFDLAAVLLLLVGGILLPVVGWFTGAGMLVASRHWRPWEKALGLLVWPGGLLLPAYLAVWSVPQGCLFLARSTGNLPADHEFDGTPYERATSSFLDLRCEQPGPTWHGHPLLLVPSLLGPLLIGWYLLRRAQTARA